MNVGKRRNRILVSILLFIIGFTITSSISIQAMTRGSNKAAVILFLILATGIMYFFKREVVQVMRNTKWFEAVTLVSISLIGHAVTLHWIGTYTHKPMWPFDSYGASFLLLNDFYIWVKPIDIVMQQLLIIVLVLKLSQYGMKLRQIITVCLVGFGGVHIFQILRTDLIIGLLFTLGAIIFSFVFPHMILRVRNGYIYNFMMHLGIYNIAALVAWGFY